MNPLVLEYVLEGYSRGYNFTSPTHGYDDGTLKQIWRGAMPRGQGWGAEAYLGARSLKCFSLNVRQFAFVEAVVTDQRDETGRKGIRRAVISVMSNELCAGYLRSRLEDYPRETLAEIAKLPSARQWAQILDRTALKWKGGAQLVLTRGYTLEDWQVVEALILKLVLSRRLALKQQGAVVPFTTLALDAREEAPLVGVPAGATGSQEAVAI
jgi:hypothetical protein